MLCSGQCIGNLPPSPVSWPERSPFFSPPIEICKGAIRTAGNLWLWLKRLCHKLYSRERKNILYVLTSKIIVLTVARALFKGTVSRNVCHFWPKRFFLGPKWTDRNGWVNFFVFAKILAENMCPRSLRRLHGLTIFELYDRISSRKRKSSRNRVHLFIWGTGRIFLARFLRPVNGAKV